MQEKQFNLAEYLAKRLFVLAGIGFVALLAALCTYVFNFSHRTGDWELSTSRGDWGTFGDFMGGTLNPIFSLLAFLGILFTIILQARQVQHAQEQTEVLRHQSGLEEMQRVMSSVAIRVDSLLAEPIQLPEDKFRLLVKRPRSMFELISALGTLKVNDGRERDPLAPDWEQWHWTDKAAALTEELGTLTVPLRLELEALAWMLNRYKAAEGNQTVQGFYSYRYFAVVVWLDALGLISNHGQLQMFFEPASKRDFMKA